MQFIYSDSFLFQHVQGVLHSIALCQTCSIHHLLNTLGSIHPFIRFKAPRVIQVQLPSLSIVRYSVTAE